MFSVYFQFLAKNHQLLVPLKVSNADVRSARETVMVSEPYLRKFSETVEIFCLY